MKLIFTFTLFTLTFVSAFADSSAIKKQVLISVGDFKEISQDVWKKETCYQAYLLANQVVEKGVDVQCHSIQTDNFLDAKLQRLLKKSDYHIRLLRTRDDSVQIYFSKLGKQHETDFENKSLTLKGAGLSKVTQEAALSKALGNFFFYVDNETAFKAGLLFNGLGESKEIKFDQNKNVFVDAKTKISLSVNRAYAIFEQESPRIKNYLRTGIEIGVLLSSAMAIYYRNLVFNQVDFDYGFREGLKKKFNGEAIRFDDNDKFSNYGHSYAGGLYYPVARSNGFGALESFLITLGSSTAWEFLEYHEVLSINDQLLTPLGGYVLGEASYQISCALFQKDNKIAKVLGYAINPGLAVNHGIDKWKSQNPFLSQPDCQKPRWSDISVYVGLEQGRKAYEPKMNTNTLLGLDALVINLEGTGEPGKVSKLIYDPSLVQVLAEANGNEGLIDLRVIAQVVSAAYHRKNLSQNDQGQLSGYDFILGLGSASTWDDRGTEEGTDNEDFYGTVNVLGATAHANIHYKGFTIEADFGFYGDFAMVKSYSLSAYKAEQPQGLTGTSSVLQRKNYYWGMGTSTLAAISLQKGRWEIGYRGQQSSARSIHGHDRRQEEVTNPDTFSDSIQINRIFISYKITKNLSFRLSREYRTRKGSVAGAYHTAGTETRTMGTLDYHF